MLSPSYINSLPDTLVELYARAEADILADMARRISTYDYWIPAAQHQVVKLKEMGMTRDEITKRLSALTGKNQKELKLLMKDAGVKTIRAEDTTYKAAGMTPPSPAESATLQKTLNAGLKRTTGTFKNLTKTTATRLLGNLRMRWTVRGFRSAPEPLTTTRRYGWPSRI